MSNAVLQYFSLRLFVAEAPFPFGYMYMKFVVSKWYWGKFSVVHSGLPYRLSLYQFSLRLCHHVLVQWHIWRRSIKWLSPHYDDSYVASTVITIRILTGSLLICYNQHVWLAFLHRLHTALLVAWTCCTLRFSYSVANTNFVIYSYKFITKSRDLLVVNAIEGQQSIVWDYCVRDFTQKVLDSPKFEKVSTVTHSVTCQRRLFTATDVRTSCLSV